MTPDEYQRFDAIGLAHLVASGEVTARELIESAATLIERENPTLNAVIELDIDRAVGAVEDLPAGPLRGVPWLIKDLNTTAKGLHDTNGSRAFKGPPAVADSALVGRHRAAGLVVMGKTNTPEFGMNVCTAPTRFGPTRHPLDHSRSVGGSSGGAGAAVAAGLLPAAHATDSGGSIRIPAANCGLFGLKPSRSRVPLGNDASEGLGGLSTGHCVSFSVRDSALVLDLTHGPLPGDGYAAPPPTGRFLAAANGAGPGQLRIGLLTAGHAGEYVDPVCVAVAEDAGRLLESLGHTVDVVASPIDGYRYRSALGPLFSVNLALIANALPPGAEESLEPATRAAVERGRVVAAPAYAQAQLDLRLTTGQLGDFFGRYDLLVTPTLASPPRPIGYHDATNSDWESFLGRMLDDIPFTPLFNASGGPAMSVPLGRDGLGLPVGVHFGAALGGEELLLGLARQLELAAPWHNRR